jgi:hypothetical protein
MGDSPEAAVIRKRPKKSVADYDEISEATWVWAWRLEPVKMYKGFTIKYDYARALRQLRKNYYLEKVEPLKERILVHLNQVMGMFVLRLVWEVPGDVKPISKSRIWFDHTKGVFLGNKSTDVYIQTITEAYQHAKEDEILGLVPIVVALFQRIVSSSS